MRARLTWPYHSQQISRISLSTFLLFFSSLASGASTTQSTFDATTTELPPDRTPSLSVPMASTPTSSRLVYRRPLTTLTGSWTPNSTMSSTTTMDGSPQDPGQLFPLADPVDADEQRKESVFNYYFLFLAAFGVLLVVGLWMMHKRREKKKEQRRRSGHNALARDLDGWVNTRRWMHGAWRPAAGFVRREEGLNEHGEAPPPYQPKSADTVVVQGHDGTAQDSTNGLTIPLRTLSRTDVERSRLPGYEEASGTPSMRPDTAMTRITRQDTTDRHPSSSTRDLIRVQSNQSSNGRAS
jgi:hypothetical protein